MRDDARATPGDAAGGAKPGAPNGTQASAPAATPAARSLAGLRVAVTRPRAQAGDFVRALEAHGAEAVVCPLIRIVDPADPAPLRRAADRIGSYDWVVFTSVNGVDRFIDALRAAGRDAGALGPPLRIACIGPATAGAVEAYGVEAAVVPDEYVAEAVLDALEREIAEPEGARVLLPRAAGARAVLREGLERHGAVVDEVEAYRAVEDEEGAAALRAALADGRIDALTFTASSTVDRFVGAVGTDVANARVAAIGPITASTARRHGLVVHVQASEYTIGGLVDALCAAFGARAGGPAATS